MTTKQKRAKNRKRQRTTTVSIESSTSPHDVLDSTVYWATPRVWSRRCGVCGRKGSEAYRHLDQSSLCGVCVEQLGVRVRESGAMRRLT